MFSMVLTWVGALLGLVLLIAMAAGTFAVDFDDRLQERRRRSARGQPSPGPARDLRLGLGSGAGRFAYLTSDLGHGYVDVNAGYRS